MFLEHYYAAMEDDDVCQDNEVGQGSNPEELDATVSDEFEDNGDAKALRG